MPSPRFAPFHAVPRPACAIFLALFAYFLALNYFCPPQGDDYDYVGVSDHLSAALNAFKQWNSRLGQLLFGGVVSRLDFVVFDALNALVAAVFIVLFFGFCALRLPKTAHDFALAALTVALFALLSPFEEVFLWGSGALNYLWGFVLALVFALPFRFYFGESCPLNAPPQLRNSTSPKRFARFAAFLAVALFLLGVIVGAWHESISSLLLVVLSALVLQERFALKRHIPLWATAGLLGLLAGFLFLYFSPGQNSRIADEAARYGYVGFGEILSLGLGENLGRIYAVFDIALTKNPLFFPLFGFALATIAIIKNATKNRLWRFTAFALCAALFAVVLLSFVVWAYALLWGLFFYVYAKTKNRLALATFALVGVYFLSILSTAQFLALPFRARSFGQLFLIAPIVMFFAQFSKKWLSAAIFAVCAGVLAYVLSGYVEVRQKFDNLVKIVAEQSKNAPVEAFSLTIMGNKKLDIVGYGVDIVVPREAYSFANSRLGPWWRLSSDPSHETNQGYARVFRVRSIRLE